MTEFDVAVVGGGPGGYVAAVRAAKLGLKTALVEKEKVGGVCVNWGCIPTKALLRNAEVAHLLTQGRTFGFSLDNLVLDYASAQKRSRQTSTRQGRRVEALLKSAGVEVVVGTAFLKSPTEIEVRPDGRILNARNIVVATGARTRELPGIPFDGERVIAFRRALELTRVPKSVVIVGAGPIGMEFATVWNRFGAKVTVVELMPRVLPLEDEEIGIEAERQFKRTKMEVLTNAAVTGVVRTENGVSVTVKSADKEKTLEAEIVLAAIGFVPNSEGLGLEKLGVNLTRGRIEIDDQMRTNLPGLYAIGDVTGKLGLAHTASAQALIAAESIAGLATHPLEYENIPRCVYAYPEAASVGLTEAQARDRGHDIQTVNSPFAPNGKAVALDENIGFVKIVADKQTMRVLGVHMIGPHVTELIAGPAGMIAIGATVEQMTRAVYPHPTLSEALVEGLHVLAGHAVHLG
jgi:dihydrolipoamide dehydrogenase